MLINNKFFAFPCNKCHNNILYGKKDVDIIRTVHAKGLLGTFAV